MRNQSKKCIHVYISIENIIRSGDTLMHKAGRPNSYIFQFFNISSG